MKFRREEERAGEDTIPTFPGHWRQKDRRFKRCMEEEVVEDELDQVECPDEESESLSPESLCSGWLKQHL